MLYAVQLHRSAHAQNHDEWIRRPAQPARQERGQGAHDPEDPPAPPGQTGPKPGADARGVQATARGPARTLGLDRG